MANARQAWAPLLAALVLAAVDGRNLAAQQVSSAQHVLHSGPEYFATDVEYLPADGSHLVPTGPFPPVRFVSYPKAPASKWYFLVDAMALKRDANGDRDFAAILVDHDSDPLTPDIPRAVLGTQDLDFGFPLGVRAMVGRRLGDWYGVELSYFGLFDSSDSAAVRNSSPNAGGGIGNMFSPFSDFGTNPAGGMPGLDFNNLASISYVSNMDNVELNLRRTLVMPSEILQVSLLVGGRFMGIDERFNYFTDSDVPLGLGTTNFVGTATDNQMYGVQLGGLFEFQVEPSWWIDTEIKGVVFDNRASQSTNYTYSINGIETKFPSTRSDHRTTFALDLSLTLSGQVNSWLTYRIGYQAIWIDGLALASENFQDDWNLLTLGPPQLNTDGKTVYHGPHIGITGVW